MCHHASFNPVQVCYNAGSRSADIYWTEVEEEQEEDGGDEKNSESVIYLLTMQEGEVRKKFGFRYQGC